MSGENARCTILHIFSFSVDFSAIFWGGRKKITLHIDISLHWVYLWINLSGGVNMHTHCSVDFPSMSSPLPSSCIHLTYPVNACLHCLRAQLVIMGGTMLTSQSLCKQSTRGRAVGGNCFFSNQSARAGHWSLHIWPETLFQYVTAVYMHMRTCMFMLVLSWKWSGFACEGKSDNDGY